MDLLLCETTFDTLNLKAALYAIEELFEEGCRRVPVMATFFVDIAGGNFPGRMSRRCGIASRMSIWREWG